MEDIQANVSTSDRVSLEAVRDGAVQAKAVVFNLKLSTIIHIAVTVFAVGVLYAGEQASMHQARLDIDALKAANAEIRQNTQLRQEQLAAISGQLSVAITQIVSLQKQVEDLSQKMWQDRISTPRGGGRYN